MKVALELVSQRLRENPPRVRPGMPPPSAYPRPLGSMAMLFPIPPGLAGIVQASAGVLLGFNGLVEAQYRMFVPDTKIGCIIGKGGDVSKLIPDMLLGTPGNFFSFCARDILEFFNAL